MTGLRLQDGWEVTVEDAQFLSEHTIKRDVAGCDATGEDYGRAVALDFSGYVHSNSK